MGKAPQAILDLVEHFARNIESFRGAGYNEAQVRKEFIDPMFEALGWDLANRSGAAEAYKDVINEDAIKVGGTTKAPDYCFRIGGTRKFFVEAKRPAVDIVYDADAAYQLRRYAWSSKLPLSILTNFQEFAVYDCRVPPNRSDKASIPRIFLRNYTDYAEQWENIADIFSKEAVLKGFFDKYAEAKRGKRGTSEVDAEFLKEIEKWREKLARNFSHRNDSISAEQLNTAVQSTIDRIIFLRMCEDRGIEQEGQLQALVSGEHTYRRLIEVFYRADERYNSGLFHFRPEKGRPSRPDELTPELTLDDDVLKEILGSLYYPHCPYEFSVMPTEILGNVYEQFLGKVIRLTAGHNARVEEKPEVRKAGGVYYTPQYIVDYIVRNTVGKLCEGKRPEEISELRILDPACGSGSFLLGAYQYLMAFHRDWYFAHGPEKHTKEVYQGRGGQWFLSTAEKKRILLNNIYGVDIDPQAVEVTKPSLLLKVLDEESSETLAQTLRSRHERALPDLDGNIKCGNSLVGPDFYEGKEPKSFTEEERCRINAFDWQAEFPQVFAPVKDAKNGGAFHAVIGNPPYSAKQSVQTKTLMQFFECVEYKCDPYAFFVEQGLRKLRRGGLLGYIVPVTWMTNFYYRKLRQLMIDSRSLSNVVLIDGLVFEKAKVDTCLLFLRKASVESGGFDWSRAVPTNLNGPSLFRPYKAVQAEERYDIPPAFDQEWINTKSKMDQSSVRLDTLCKISLGMILRSNQEFIARKNDTRHPDPIYFGDDISRYGFLKPSRFFDFAGAVVVGGTKKPEIHRAKPKLFVQAIRNLSLKRRIVAALDTNGSCFVGTVNGLTFHESDCDIRYFLGLLNSELLNTYFRKRFTTISLKAASLGVLPIRKIEFSEATDKSLHDRMVELVDRMLELHKRLPKAKTADEKKQLEREIQQTDNQIERLVYELYDLTEEEIKIVEEAGSA